MLMRDDVHAGWLSCQYTDLQAETRQNAILRALSDTSNSVERLAAEAATKFERCQALITREEVGRSWIVNGEGPGRSA